MISTQNDAQTVFRFGHYELNTATHELRRDGRVVRMQRQPAIVLCYLIRNSGRIVAREELKTQLWGEDTFVDFDSGLNFCIRQIRTALRDNAAEPVYVETVPRVGYRFIAPLASADSPSEPTAEQVVAKSSPESRGELPPELKNDPGSIRSHNKLHYVTTATALFALVALVIVLFLNRAERRRVAGLPLTLTKVTSTGRILRVAISPDGQYMAYISNDGDGRSLWLKHLATGSERQLLPSTPGMFGLLKFSRDGSYVYFARVDDAAHGLYRVAQLGGDPQAIISDIPFGLGISPNGNEIALLENEPAGYPIKIFTLSDQKTRTVAFLPVRDYYVDSLPTISFSADGDAISLAVGKVQGTNSAIVTFGTKSGSRQEIALPFKAADAILIPARKAFLVSASIETENAGHLWLQPADGSAPQPLLGASNFYPLLDVANDGRNAVAISLEGYISAEVWQGNSGKKMLATLTDPFPQVRWLGTSRLGIVSETGKLETLNSTSGEIVNVLDDRTVRLAPCPDQKTLLLLRKTVDEKPALWILDNQSSKLSRLTYGEDADPKCTPDGTWAYYVHLDGTRSSFWRSSLDGKSREEIKLGDSQLQTQFDLHFDYSVSPGPDPTGKWIAVRAKRNDKAKLLFVSTVTRNVEHELDVPRDAYDLKWKPDGKSVTFINGKDPRWSLYELAVPSGPIVRLTNGNDAGIVDYDWSADGRLAILKGFRIADVVRFTLF